MNKIDLESWASRAAVELKTVLTDTLEAAGLDQPDAGSEASTLLALIEEYDDICHGRPTWQSRATAGPADMPPGLAILGQQDDD